MDMNVQTRDLLQRVDLPMDKTIGRVVIDGCVQVGKPLDVHHSHLIVDPNLQCLVVGWHPDSQNGKVR